MNAKSFYTILTELLLKSAILRSLFLSEKNRVNGI